MPRIMHYAEYHFTTPCMYAVGGLVPLAPYFFMESAKSALGVSAVLTLSALLVFDYVKGLYSGVHPVKNSLQTILIGGCAAATAFLVARDLSLNFYA